MPLNELSPDLRRFIVSSVPSVPFLEAVLLLRAAPDETWNAAQLARRLYVPERGAAVLLAQLRDSGITAPAGNGDAWRYAPDAALAGMLDQVAHAYATKLVAVSGLIHSRIDRRAQQFADAFRFRKD
jgi:hypothetical protein